MSQFKVVLDGIKLDDKRGARISNAIQRAVLAELADFDAGGDEGSLIVEKLGPETRGLIAMRVNLRQPSLERLDDVNKRFEQGF